MSKTSISRGRVRTWRNTSITPNLAETGRYLFIPVWKVEVHLGIPLPRYRYLQLYPRLESYLLPLRCDLTAFLASPSHSVRTSNIPQHYFSSGIFQEIVFRSQEELKSLNPPMNPRHQKRKNNRPWACSWRRCARRWTACFGSLWSGGGSRRPIRTGERRCGPTRCGRQPIHQPMSFAASVVREESPPSN